MNHGIRLHVVHQAAHGVGIAQVKLMASSRHRNAGDSALHMAAYKAARAGQKRLHVVVLLRISSGAGCALAILMSASGFAR